MSGQLRDAAKGKGNFGRGTTTRSQADEMGKAWVGKNPKLASDGKTLVSKDGYRQYRPPSTKPNRGILQQVYKLTLSVSNPRVTDKEMVT